MGIWKRGHRRLGWALAALIAFACVQSCQPKTRYRTLSFFFDGVPNPDAPIEAVHRPDREESPFHPVRRPPAPTPAPIRSIHQPARQNQCLQCHDSVTMAPLALDATLCDKCHLEQRLREGWAHGPINLGTCVPCHDPHDSPYLHLLEKPVPDLCLDCHAEDMARQETYHEVPEVDACIQCHDPHRMY
jgi:predicted CXXCH cytochrome family protein